MSAEPGALLDAVDVAAPGSVRAAHAAWDGAGNTQMHTGVGMAITYVYNFF